MSKKSTSRRIGQICICLGLCMLLFSLGLTGYNIHDEKRANESASTVLSEVIKIQDKVQFVHDKNYKPIYQVEKEIEMPTVEINGHSYCGSVAIPSLGVDLPVLDELSDSLLKVSPCRYGGSVYKNEMIIAAHNYRSHFGHLKNLVKGDKVIFTDMDGNKFNYTVAYSELIDKTGIEELEGGDWDLTLFTCTVGGAMRVTVRCFLDEK